MNMRSAYHGVGYILDTDSDDVLAQKKKGGMCIASNHVGQTRDKHGQSAGNPSVTT